jgi:hypothetical protein
MRLLHLASRHLTPHKYVDVYRRVSFVMTHANVYALNCPGAGGRRPGSCPSRDYDIVVPN